MRTPLQCIKQTLRTLVVAAAAALPAASSAEMVIESIRPLIGVPGTVVTVSGSGFSAGGATQVRIGETGATVRAVGAESVSFEVPAGSVNGPITVRQGAEEVQSGVPFTVMRSITGELALPAGVSPEGYHVGALHDLMTVGGGEVGFSTEVYRDEAMLVVATRGEGDPTFMALVTTEMEHVVIDASSTAVATPFMMPGIATRRDAAARAYRDAVVTLPEYGALREVIESGSSGGRNYQDDPHYGTALGDVLGALPDLSPEAAPPALRAFNHLTRGAVPGTWRRELNPDNGAEISLHTDFVKKPDGSLKVATTAPGTTPLNWNLELFQLDPEQFSSGLDSIDQAAPNQAFDLGSGVPVRAGFLTAKTVSAQADLVKKGLEDLTNYLIGGDLLREELTEFTVPGDAPGVYLLQAYSGNLFYGSEVIAGPGVTQVNTLNRQDPNSMWEHALASNLFEVVFEAVSVFIPTAAIGQAAESLVSLWDIACDVYRDVARAVARIASSPGGLSLAALGDLVVTTAKSLVTNLFDFGFTTVKGVALTFGRALKFWSRAVAFSSLLERGVQGLIRGKYLALERTILVVGHPFTPQVTQIGTSRGVGGDEIMVYGYNFPEDPGAGEFEVLFCQYASTVPPGEEPRVEVQVPAEIIYHSGRSIRVRVPRGFDDGGGSVFEGDRAFVCVKWKGEIVPPSPKHALADRRFTYVPPPVIDSVDVSAATGVLWIRGEHFKRFKDSGVRVWIDDEEHYPGWLLASSEDCLTVDAGPLREGAHSVRVQIGEESSNLLTFDFAVPPTPGHDGRGRQPLPLPQGSGRTILVSRLDFSNAADGEISLGEALLLAAGKLGRPIEEHLPCESLPPDDPAYCPPQQREEDFIYGDREGEDTIWVLERLDPGNQTVLLPAPLAPPGDGDHYYFNGLTLDGGNTHAVGWTLDGQINTVLADCTLKNFTSHGVHVSHGTSYNTVRGVVVENCGGDGLRVEDSTLNHLQIEARGVGMHGGFLRNSSSNVIGLVVDGCGSDGLVVTGASIGNTFGTGVPAPEITDAGGHGIVLRGSSIGNRFSRIKVVNAGGNGVWLSGAGVVGNRFHDPFYLPNSADTTRGVHGSGEYGWLVEGGARENQIHPAGTMSNAKGGVWIRGSETRSNIIGNPDESDYANPPFWVVNNGGTGIRVTDAAENVIQSIAVTGNLGDGVVLEGDDCHGNQVHYIVMEASGGFNDAVGNRGNGLVLRDGAHRNLIGSNVESYIQFMSTFSGNDENGILIEGENTRENTLKRLFVGYSSFGDFVGSPDNGANGLLIRGGSHGNVIGDVSQWKGVNIFGSPNGAGIRIEGEGTDGNTMYGCQIGAAYYSENLVPDIPAVPIFEEYLVGGAVKVGIEIVDGAKGNQIGLPGEIVDARNEIWGAIPHRPGNFIGHCTEAGISIENAGGFLNLVGQVSAPNRIVNCTIGEGEDGTKTPNVCGIHLGRGAWMNEIGGALPGLGNRIVSNRECGLRLTGAGVELPEESMRNRIQGNLIRGTGEGVSLTNPTAGLSPGTGIVIDGSFHHVVGEWIGTANEIDANWVGIHVRGRSGGNTIRGNRITRSGFAGIVVSDSDSTLIGGERGEQNVILENGGWEPGGGVPGEGGIVLIDSHFNVVASNEVSGNHGAGIVLLRSSANSIGLVDRGRGNRLTGNLGVGIRVSGVASVANRIALNEIGTGDEPNGGDGVFIGDGASQNIVGGYGSLDLGGLTVSVGTGNEIVSNGRHGVAVDGAGSTGNQILNNSITRNVGRGIALLNGANRGQVAPASARLEGDGISGQIDDLSAIPAGSRIQVFSDAGGVDFEGEFFEGSTFVRADGSWSITAIPQWFPTGGANLTMTATGAGHRSTSEFRRVAFVPDPGEAGLVVSRTDGATAPAARNVVSGRGLQEVLGLRFRAVNTEARLGSVRVSAAGTVDDRQVGAVRAYHDANGDGRVSPGEVAIGRGGVFDDDDGALTLDLGGLFVGAGGGVDVVVAYETLPGAPSVGETFSVELPSATSVVATLPLGALPVMAGGAFPLRSDVFTLVEGGGGYAEWSETWLAGYSEAERLPGADADGDGRSNLEEMATGTHPGVADVGPGLEVVISPGGFVWFRFEKVEDLRGVGLVLELSSGLGEWVASGALVERVERTPTGNGMESIEYRTRLTPTEASEIFARLRFELD